MGSIPDWPRRAPADDKESPVKELTHDEVLAIAGGLPPGVALDEIFYRAPAEPVQDPMACAELAAEEAPRASTR
jgi:hypothetical protein